MSELPDWLSPEGREVYNKTLARLKDPTPEQFEMLAAYAHAVTQLRRWQADPPRAAEWRKAMLYARNGLGIWPPVFVDMFALLLDWDVNDEPMTIAHLKREWQLPESERPEE